MTYFTDSDNAGETEHTVMTTEECSKEIDRSPSDIESLVYSGDLRGAVLGRHLRILRPDFDAFRRDAELPSDNELFDSVFAGLSKWLGTGEVGQFLRLSQSETRVLFRAAIIPSQNVSRAWITHRLMVASVFDPDLVPQEIEKYLFHRSYAKSQQRTSNDGRSRMHRRTDKR